MLPLIRPALARLASSLILLLMAQSLLLPIYGPWLDHGFAARQANHKHIYFGKVDPHHHGHHGHKGDAHRHRHSAHDHGLCDDALHDEHNEVAEAVINLPNLDAANQGQVVVLSFSEILAFLLAAAQDSSLVFALSDYTVTSQGISRAPPHQPPRPAQ